MNIRRAEERDIERIGELLLQVCEVHHEGRPDLFRAGGRKYTAGDLKAMLADDERPIFVAEDADLGIAGYAFCQHIRHVGSPSLTDIHTLYIDDLCVDERARGRHVGTELYAFVLAYARDCGCHNVTLNVWAENKGARAFYESLGLSVQKIGLEQVL